VNFQQLTPDEKFCGSRADEPEKQRCIRYKGGNCPLICQGIGKTSRTILSGGTEQAASNRVKQYC
jgi:hypothetical protein